MVTLLLMEGGYGNFPLHRASQEGNVKFVLILLGNNYDINQKDDAKQTPLHLACEFGQLEVAEELINRQAYLDASNNDQLTPLRVAIRKGRVEMTKLLLDHKADNKQRMMCFEPLCMMLANRVTLR